MRAYHRLVAALLGMAALAGCGEQAAPAPAADPLSVSPAFLDLGSVPRGERTTGSWTLTNVSDAPVQLLRVGPLPCSCGHAELLLPSRPAGHDRMRVDGGLIDVRLAPGEEAEVRFTFDSSRYRQPISRKVVSLPVVLAEHAGVVLEAGVDVWTPFVVEPWAIQLGEVGVRERASGFVLVAAHDDESFGLPIDEEVEGWHVLSEKVSTGERDSYKLTVTAPPELAEGPFDQEFVFLTDLAGAPPVRFHVQGIAVRDIGVSPGRVVFEPATGRRTAEVTIFHRAADGALGALALADEEGPVVLEEQRADGPRRRVLVLRWTGEVPEGLESGRLKVDTGDEHVPTVEVPWSVMPARG